MHNGRYPRVMLISQPGLLVGTLLWTPLDPVEAVYCRIQQELDQQYLEAIAQHAYVTCKAISIWTTSVYIWARPPQPYTAEPVF